MEHAAREERYFKKVMYLEEVLKKELSPFRVYVLLQDGVRIDVIDKKIGYTKRIEKTTIELVVDIDLLAHELSREIRDGFKNFHAEEA